jgi:hypothetical protein
MWQGLQGFRRYYCQIRRAIRLSDQFSGLGEAEVYGKRHQRLQKHASRVQIYHYNRPWWSILKITNTRVSDVKQSQSHPTPRPLLRALAETYSQQTQTQQR